LGWTLAAGGDVAEPGGKLTIGLLGPFEVALDGRPVELTTGRLRTLLAVLALSAGRPVSVDRLATALWGDDPPDNARRSVQTYLARLRSAIGAEKITTGPTGYRLRVDPDRVDALRFTRLLDQADQATERDRLAEALALWRGNPLTGIRSDWLERVEAPRLTERYLAAVERRIDLDLADGHHHELVVPLEELVVPHPLRESLWVRLLLALDRSGRHAEALERYETIRVRLAEELGTDPGPELRQVHADLLAGRPAESAPPAQSVTPRQLPADIDGFTGRAAALKALDDLISEGDGQTSQAVVISAIAGTAGVGKTTLAVRWAHQVGDRFPDGQLYVNLRGFHPSGPAVEPAEAIRGFLDALGVPAQRVPADLDAQAGLYRSLLAGKRMLILLDNARDAEQARPLLPGSRTCLALVTSRNQLTSLVAADAAQPLVLDLLSIEESRELLARRLGPDRITAEPAATDEIISNCARLPLALAIAAARAATRPGFPLATLAAELRDAGYGGLAALTAGDPSTDVRTVFSWSYRALSAGAARLFRLLGLHPGPDVSRPAAASLAGLPVPELRGPLAELCRAHLLTEPVPGRYACHDLLRAFAAELAEATDPAVARHAARHRLLDHYLHTANAAGQVIAPQRLPISPSAAQPGVHPEPLDDHVQATGWLTAERPVLLAAVAQAYHHGFDVHAWQLAWALAGFLDRRGEWHDMAATAQIGLDAATRLGDPAAEAFTYRNLAGSASSRGRYEEAGAQLERALAGFRELGDLPNQARTRLVLAQVDGRRGRTTEALEHTRAALDLYGAAGHRGGQAEALNGVGWFYAQLGDHEQALSYCQQALVILREVGDRRGEAGTLDTIGYAHHHLGRHRPAVTYLRRALTIYQELDERYYLADTLVHLGDAQLAAGDADAARTSFRQALAILDQLDHPDAAQARERLAGLGRRQE
jgi:DNA-binding SARP family transcriptional activator/tetratricopeptide (TPR) repeat protein